MYSKIAGSLKAKITLTALLISTVTSCFSQKNVIPDLSILTPKSVLVDKQLKEKLKFIDDVVKFGEEKLGLEESPHYKNYIDPLPPEENLYILSVTLPTLLPEHRTEEYLNIDKNVEHQLIIKGSVYLNSQVDNLQDEKKYYDGHGYDTHWRSTVNYNNNSNNRGSPITRFFLERNQLEQVQTIFHESCHYSVGKWVGELSSELDESACTAIANAGAEDYFKTKFGKNSSQYQEAVQASEGYKNYSHIINHTYEDLHTIYDNVNLTFKEKLEKREIVFNKLKKTIGWDEINNAVLWSRRPYTKYYPLISELHFSHENDVKKTINIVKNCPDQIDSALLYFFDRLGNRRLESGSVFYN